jgi:hypothetical protein
MPRAIIDNALDCAGAEFEENGRATLQVSTHFSNNNNPKSPME